MPLRILIVEENSARAERLSSALEGEDYDVLPLPALRDAAEAVSLQHFDAVIVPPTASDSDLETFAAKLKQIESSSRSQGHTAILSCGGSENRPAIEAQLPYEFEIKAFGAAMSKLAQRVANPDRPVSPAGASKPAVFNEIEFRGQMCGDEELMVEIIDLYLVESRKQRKEMEEALGREDLASISRLAHTLKGSLGSLHTPRAWACAQELELAAKRQQSDAATRAWIALEAELAAVEPVLKAFRDR